MAMSLSSLASKLSPHSTHSTNSASSSRATICTRGCLHASMRFLSVGVGDDGVGVIIRIKIPLPEQRVCCSPEIDGYFRPMLQVVKSHNRNGPGSLALLCPLVCE